jgi:AraC family transcriptional regulator
MVKPAAASIGSRSQRNVLRLGPDVLGVVPGRVTPGRAVRRAGEPAAEHLGCRCWGPACASSSISHGSSVRPIWPRAAVPPPVWRGSCATRYSRAVVPDDRPAFRTARLARPAEQGSSPSVPSWAARRCATAIKHGARLAWHDRHMSAAADTFASFLEILARTMDDHGASGDSMAARAHLSRFHFDRLVSAAAGEPPAALRRRILLERAAYRLITTDHDVLRVAIEAGYASHEAFTRAFTRAYGQPPAHWRRERASFLIGTPRQVHFSPPGGLRVPAQRKVTAMDLVTRMIEHHVWLVGQMLVRAETLPQERLDARVEISVDGIDDEPTLRSLLARLVGQLGMWDAAMHERPYDMSGERAQTVAQLRAKLAEVGPSFVAQVHAIVDGGRLDETFVDAVCDPPEVFTYGGMIAHVLTFAAHRRTLVCGALIDAGVTDLGAGDPMRWVAEPAA